MSCASPGASGFQKKQMAFPTQLNCLTLTSFARKKIFSQHHRHSEHAHRRGVNTSIITPPCGKFWRIVCPCFDLHSVARCDDHNKAMVNTKTIVWCQRIWCHLRCRDLCHPNRPILADASQPGTPQQFSEWKIVEEYPAGVNCTLDLIHICLSFFRPKLQSLAVQTIASTNFYRFCVGKVRTLKWMVEKL